MHNPTGEYLGDRSDSMAAVWMDRQCSVKGFLAFEVVAESDVSRHRNFETHPPKSPDFGFLQEAYLGIPSS